MNKLEIGLESTHVIAHLHGRLLSKAPNRAVIGCSGVGYEVLISVPTFHALGGVDATVSVHVHTHVREDQIVLFGFADPAEKRAFERLIAISGVGPKMALTLLSGIALDRFVAAVRAEDHAVLTRIPGIGKKTAERIVLELKDKLEDFAAAGGATPAPSGQSFGPAGDDALSALVNLGYARPAAERAVTEAIRREPDVAGDFEQLFRAAMAGMR